MPKYKADDYPQTVTDTGQEKYKFHVKKYLRIEKRDMRTFIYISLYE